MNAEIKKINEGMMPSSQKTYKNSYLKLRDVLGLADKRKRVKNVFLLDDILIKLNDIPNPNTRYSVFKIVVKLFPEKQYEDTIANYFTEIKTVVRKHKVCDNKQLQTTIASYDDINKAIKKETNPLVYITSFLIFRVNSRNQDIAYTKVHKSVDNEDALDNSMNHLYIKNGKAVWIRNIYKTAKTYGQKRNVINVKKFVAMIQQFLGEADSKMLYSKSDGSPVSITSVASYLRRRIVLGLTEGEIVKSVLSHIEKNGDNQMLRAVADNRGTSIAVLMKEYDVNNVDEPTDVICD
jgi:hypothetical protein